MGLDAYFYRRTKVTENDIVTDDLLLNTFHSSDKLKDKLSRLNAYAKARDKSLYECLDEAINDYLNNYGEGYSNELLYFRKFHYLLNYFDYDDEWYSRDMPVTKEQCIDLRDKAKACLEECDKVYKDRGRYVTSYLTREVLSATRNYERSFDYEDDTGTIINEICNRHFPSTWKDAMYDKVGHLYQGMNTILNETDWDKQTIVFNADW